MRRKKTWISVATITLLVLSSVAAAQQPYDHSNLRVFRNNDGQLEPVETARDWSQRRADILAGMQNAMGPLPDPRPSPDFDLRITERTSGNGFERLTVDFSVEARDRLTAHLYLPTARESKEKRPAVLALHPTGAAGKRIIAGEAAGGKPNRQYAMELAERGYVVLAPDYPSFGGLKDYDFAADNYVSGTMKGIVNHMRCVDLLASRPEVDANRIGVIGHSLGGHNALFVAAFDKRLKVAVTSCGWTPFHYYYGGNVKGWTSDRYMPLIRDHFELSADKIPFDFYEVIAAIAPRAVYSASPIGDANFAVAGVKDAEPKIRSIFELFKTKQKFAVEYPNCAHDFPKDVRSRAYAFIDKHLSFNPVTNTNFAAELPRLSPTEPDKALDTFTVHPDFQLELIASEPNVVDPVAACYDAWGRLYVVEMRGYSEDRDKELGRVRLLEDRDNDGVYEHSSVFADRLKWPTAIVPFDRGVFVAAAPDILYLKDGAVAGNSDGIADRLSDSSYPRVLTGLKHSNVQGLVNSMRWGLDGRIHVATSSSGAELIRAGRDDKPLVLRGRDFSFDPRLARLILTDKVAADAEHDLTEEQWRAEIDRVAARIVAQGFRLREAVAFAEDEIKGRRQAAARRRNRRRYSRPRKPALRAESGGGQHGMCFDDHGHKFVCQNSDHIQFVRYEDRYAARVPGLLAPRSRTSIATDGPQAEVFRLSRVEPWRLVRTRLRVSGLVRGPVEGGGRAAGYFTGATGTTIYRGNAWPSQFKDQAFVGDVGSNIVHRKILVRDGLEYRANRAREGVEFIASTDNWFRPVQFLNGPDGNLQILDMYRETIEHPASLPPQIKKHVDLTSGRDRGRIYRVVSRANPKRSGRHPAAVPIVKLVEWLDSANSWERETAARLLFEAQDDRTVEPLKTLATEGKTALGRLHALYSLFNVRSALDETVLLSALQDKDAHVREHAVRLAEPKMSRSEPLQSAVAALCDDEEIRVRTQVAFSSFTLGDQLLPTVEAILRRDSDSRLSVYAAVASASGRVPEILKKLLSDREYRTSVHGLYAIDRLTELGLKEDAAPMLMKMALSVSFVAESDEPQLADQLLRRIAPHIVKSSDLVLRDQLEKVLTAARHEASNKTIKLARRIRAAKRLGLWPNTAGVRSLTEVLVPTEPQSLQLAAIETLRDFGFDQPLVAEQVLAAYEKLTPAVQSSAVELLLSRDSWAERLLAAVNGKQLPKSTVSIAQLNLLGSSRSESVRQQATALREQLRSTSRSKIVAEWQDVPEMKADATKGRAVFRKNCAKCHKLEGFGEEIGPGLAAIRNRGIGAVLMNILDPNREVNPQYNSFVVVTDDGRSVAGIIANETASGITLRDGDKVNIAIPRDEIDEMRNTGLSLMPEGLEKQITRQQMADLLRYLMTVQQ